MADPLTSRASVASIPQLTGQLLSCIQQIRKFCRDLRNVPADLKFTLDEIENLGNIFVQTEGVDKISIRHRGLQCLQLSLRECQAAAFDLETLAIRTFHPLKKGTRFRSFHRLKAVSREQELEKFKSRLDQAKTMLQLSIGCSSMYVLTNFGEIANRL